MGGRRRATRLLQVLCALPFLLTATPTSGADPTDQEQYFVWELNRARNDPEAWALEFGLDSRIGGDGLPTDLVGVDPQPPLAVNELLIDSAVFHSEEMAINDYFAHQSAVTGDWPNLMARDTDYPLPTSVPRDGGGSFLLPDDSNQIESIACGFGAPGGDSDFSLAIKALIALIVDVGVPSLGHRTHLLGIGEFPRNFVEVGTGFATSSAGCRNYWSIHTGLKAVVETFLTGVVYADTNIDGLFNPGEGLGGVDVSIDGMSVVTNAAGGWAMAVADGTRTVGCSGGAFQGSPSVSVVVAGANREVDCVSGVDGAYVDFLLVPEPGAWLLMLSALATLCLLGRSRARP